MISVTHFSGPAADLPERAAAALAALAERTGYLRGTLGRAVDDPTGWLLVTEWTNVGSYRRALGSYDVKLRASALFGEALDLPSAFESLLEVAPGAAVVVRASDRSGSDRAPADEGVTDKAAG